MNTNDKFVENVFIDLALAFERRVLVNVFFEYVAWFKKISQK